MRNKTLLRRHSSENERRRPRYFLNGIEQISVSLDFLSRFRLKAEQQKREKKKPSDAAENSFSSIRIAHWHQLGAAVDVHD